MNNTKIQTIGDRIRLSRGKLGITQSELSRIMCLSRTICGQWERGTSVPSTLHLSRLADILGVSFEYLAKGKTEATKPVINLSDESLEKILSAKMMAIFKTMPLNKKQNLVNLFE
jgi:transcriptional regulator with XRE-family HTH domain